MSSTLTETASWVATITVPDASDDGAARHVYSEVTAQGLANRTQYLKLLAEGAVSESGGSINGDLTVDGHIVQVGGANILSTQGNATIGGDLTVGDDLTVTDNLTMNGNSFSVPNASLTLGSGSLHVTNGSVNINSGSSSLTSAGDINIASTKRVKYTGSDSDRRRQIRFRMAHGAVSQGPSNIAHNGICWVTAGAYVLSIPLPHLPHLSTIENVSLRMESTSGNATVELIRMEIGDWPLIGTPAPTADAVASGTFTSGSGVKTLTITPGATQLVDNSAYDYWLRITAGGSPSHNIYGARVQALLYSPGID